MQALRSHSTHNKVLKSRPDRWRQAGFIPHPHHPPGNPPGDCKDRICLGAAFALLPGGMRAQLHPLGSAISCIPCWGGLEASRALGDTQGAQGWCCPSRPTFATPAGPSLRQELCQAPAQPSPRPRHRRTRCCSKRVFFIDGTRARLTAHLYFSASTAATADMNLSTAECTSGEYSLPRRVASTTCKH